MSFDFDYTGDVLNSGVYSEVSTWLIVILILSVVGALLLHFLFLDPKNEKKYSNNFVKKLYEILSFKKLFLEDLLKILYLFTTLYVTFAALSLIDVSFFGCLTMLVVGNLLVRLAYEGCLLLVLLYKNVVEINGKLKK